MYFQTNESQDLALFSVVFCLSCSDTACQTGLKSFFSLSLVAHHFSSLVASQKPEISEVSPLTNGATHCEEEDGKENKRVKGHLLLPDRAVTSPFGQTPIFLDRRPLEEIQSCAARIKTAD